jgi:uncharacterized alpha-E superfamily protein
VYPESVSILFAHQMRFDTVWLHRYVEVQDPLTTMLRPSFEMTEIVAARDGQDTVMLAAKDLPHVCSNCGTDTFETIMKTLTVDKVSQSSVSCSHLYSRLFAGRCASTDHISLLHH